jgi:hypothetical protein
MQKRKIIAVIFVVAVVVVAIGYEYFTANSLSGNSLSGYTKMTLIVSQPNSIMLGGNNYGSIYFSPIGHDTYAFSFSTPSNYTEDFNAVKGAKYNFQNLQIVVGNVNSNQLILYIKHTFEPPNQ